MTKISKDGGIDDQVASASKPINRVDKVSIRALHPDAESEGQQHRITYGNKMSPAGAAANIRVDQQDSTDVTR